jgi:ubiquinone/menaquinone biosynthesis C-methylase UbiE
MVQESSSKEHGMPTKFDARNKDLLLATERQEALQPEHLLKSLGLKRGDTIADIGCGPGFFTLPAAEIVGPEGVVYAADIQGEMLTAVRSRAQEHGLSNVHVVKTNERDVPLRKESCDLVLVAFTLNEVESRAIFLLHLTRALKPKGRLAVLEWEKHQHEEGPPLADRIAPDELIADAQAAGLRLDRRRELNAHQYLCVFSRVQHG